MRHSTRSYSELLHWNAVENSDDFVENVVIKVVAMSKEHFTERFWRVSYGLLLWGRAQRLKAALKKEITRRLFLPKDGFSLVGPRLRTRRDIIEVCGRAIPKTAEESAAEAANAPRAAAAGIGTVGARAALAAKRAEFVARPKSAGFEEADTVKPMPDLPNGLTDIVRAEVVCETAEAMQTAFAALIAPPLPPKKVKPVVVDDDPKKPKTPKRKSILDLDPEEEKETAEAKWKLAKGKVMGMTRLSVMGGKTKITKTSEELEREEAQRKAEEEERDGRQSFRVIRVVNGFHNDQGDRVFPAAAGILLYGEMMWRPKQVGVPVRQLVEVELMMQTTSEARWLVDFTKLTPAETPPAFMLQRRPSSTSSAQQKTTA